jgi:acid stress-induced BolA-like protein IbaG/YrbA
MGDWASELIADIQHREIAQSQRDALRLHHAQVLKEESEHFFGELVREAKRGITAIAKHQGILANVLFEEPRSNAQHFSATNASRFPFVSVEVALSSRRILLRTKMRASAASQWDEKHSTIEMCVKDDDNLYLCCDGEPLDGIDAVLKLIARPLFHL